MTQQEFEGMAMRTGTISTHLYDSIERLYMSDSDYHRHNNAMGIDEIKQNFVRRVYGGKYNTPKTILAKTIAELQRENRYALQGNITATKDVLDHHDKMIAYHTTIESKWK